MRGAKKCKPEMRYSTICPADGIQTLDSDNSSLIVQLSHGKAKNSSPTENLSLTGNSSSEIKTSVQYSSNTVEDSSSKMNTNVWTDGIHKPEQ